MFHRHILRKNIKNEYSINTHSHTSKALTTDTINGLTYPKTDGSSGQLLKTDGSGNLSFIDSVNLAHIDIVTDDSPQLGGNLDLNGSSINGTGDISISGDITCSNITVNGSNTFLDTSTIRTEDSLIYLASGNTADTIDLGWYGKYVSSGTKYAGIFRDATDNKFKLFTNTTTEPTSTITNYTLSDLEINDLECDEITANKLDVDNLRLNLNILSSTANNLKLTASANNSIELNNSILITDDDITDVNSIGIGTNSPSEKLHVYGGNIRCDDFYTTKFEVISNRIQTHHDENFYINSALNTVFETDGTERMTLLNNGNLGIGTNNPNELLHVKGEHGIVICEGTNSSGNFHAGVDIIPQSRIRTRGIRIRNGTTNNMRWLIGNKYSSSQDNLNFLYTSTGEGTNAGNYTEFMTIKKDGNVGIGTNNPNELLHSYADNTGTLQLKVENVNSSGRAGLQIKHDGNSLNIQQNNGSAIIENYGTSGFNFYQKGSGDYYFKTTDSNTNRLCIKNDGNVGIGNISPTEKLEVTGSVLANNFKTDGTLYGMNQNYQVLSMSTNNSTECRRFLLKHRSDGSGVFRASFDYQGNSSATPTELFSIVGSGNVGINTSNPSHKLDVAGSAQFYSSGEGIKLGNHEIKLTNSGVAHWSIINDDSGILDFRKTSGSEALGEAGASFMAIKSDGKVGIGTANPQNKFHIRGTQSSVDGSHLYFTTDQDDYPVYQQLNWTHDNIALSFDCYYNGAWRMADTGSTNSCCQWYKISDKLQLRYAFDTTQGNSITWTDGITLKLKNGYVGIGTNDPKRKLHIHEPATDVGAYLMLSNGNTGTASNDGFHIATSSSGTTSYLINRENGHMSFWTNNTEKMRIKNDGKVGIGTNNPVGTLHIKSNTDILYFETERPWKFHTNGTIGASTALHLSSTVDSKNFIIDHNGDERIARFYANTDVDDCRVYLCEAGGKVGIGTTNAQNILQVSGNVGTEGIQMLVSPTDTTGQDAGLEIRSARNALADIDTARTAIYFSNYDNDLGTHRYAGRLMGTVDNHATNTGSLRIQARNVNNNGWVDGIRIGDGYGNVGIKGRALRDFEVYGKSLFRDEIEVDGDVISNGVFFGGEEGSVVKIKFLDWSDGTDVNSSSWTVTKSLSYTKKVGTKLIVQCGFDYHLNGWGTDTFSSRLRLSDDANTYVEDFSRPFDQKFDSHGGGGSRSNTLSGLCWETNSNFNNRTNVYIALQVRKNSADDQINVYEGYFLVHEVIA